MSYDLFLKAASYLTQSTIFSFTESSSGFIPPPRSPLL
eukprot:gene10747-2835_t